MEHKGTLLIFAYECYPYNRTGSTIGAQRPYQFAKNISALGWKVIVLCCDHQNRRTLDKKDLPHTVEELYKSYEEVLDKEDFCIVPLPSLKSHGWVDYLWSISVTKGPGDSYIGKGFPYSFIRKMATFYNQLVHGDYSWSWTPTAEQFAHQLVKNHKIDVIIGEHSPDAGILLARSFSKKYTIPWIADFRDPVLWPFKGIFSALYKQTIRRVVSSAQATINVNPYWSALDQDMFGIPAYTVVNGYDKQDFDLIPAYRFSFFSVSYFGSFNEEFQDIKPSITAFAEFLKRTHYPSDAKLFYRGLQQEEFITCCKKMEIPDHHLDVQSFVKREETVAFMKGSAVLLIYSIPTYKSNNVYKRKGFYPGKIFEYIGAAKPVLCIPSDHGLLEELIQNNKMGKSTSSVEEAVSFIEQEYLKWRVNKDSEPLQMEHSIEYTRQKQAQDLELILQKTIYRPNR